MKSRAALKKSEMNPQFMKILVQKEHLLHKIQEILFPTAQFEATQPDWAALFYTSHIVNMSEHPVDTLNEVLEYMTGIVLPTCQGQRNYKVHENAMKLIYAMTLSLTSLRCLERMFHDSALLGFMCAMATQNN